MRLLDSTSILNGEANLSVRPGSYAGFMLRISGVNQAGQTLTVGNLGLIRRLVKEGQKTSISFANLQNINDMTMGEVESASAAGAAFTFSSVLPASLVGDQNVFNVQKPDRHRVTVDLSGVTGTIVASGSVELYGIPMEGVQMYDPQLSTLTPSIPASSTDLLDLNQINISSLFFMSNTNLSHLVVKRDKEIHTSASIAALQAFSNMDAELESAFTAGFRLNFNRSAAIGENLSEEIELEFQTSAGIATPNIIVLSHAHTPDKLLSSRSSVVANVQRRLDVKATSGDVNSIALVKSLQA